MLCKSVWGQKNWGGFFCLFVFRNGEIWCYHHSCLLVFSSFPGLRIKNVTSIRNSFAVKKKKKKERKKVSIKIELAKIKCIITLKNKPRSLATCQGSGSAILQFSLLSSSTCWLILMPTGSSCMRSKVPFKLLSTEHPYISMILSQKFGFFKKISSMLSSHLIFHIQVYAWKQFLAKRID